MYLDTPPSCLISSDGSARVGAYEGPLGPVDFGNLNHDKAQNPLWFASHHKRWVYAFVSSKHYILAAAIAHLGYVGTTFLTILDRRTRSLLFDHANFTLPHLTTVGQRCEQGCDAHFRGLGTRVAFTRPLGSSQYLLAADTPHASVRLTLESNHAPNPIVAVSPVEDGIINVTEKRVLMPAHGVFSVDDVSDHFDDAWGGMDYTNGLLARRTNWRWAFGMGRAQDGRRVAFNLVDGYNGGLECGLWLEDMLVPTQSARFEYDPKHPLGTWTVRTPDERLDLSFRADAMHAEHTNLGFLRSSFVQPMGLFSGRLAVPGQPAATLVDVPGVVENQSVIW